ncbi:hypothetical protein ACP4OV_002402 [Aristida adscensionis]
MPACSDPTAGGSASAITAKMVIGTHELRINGYSGTKGLGVGESIKSCTFVIGGHSWCIGYYPDGADERNSDYIRLDLWLHHDHPFPNDGVKAGFKFSILRPDRSEEASVYNRSSEERRLFTSKDPAWGFDQFIRRTELESSTYLKDDGFTIKCDVTVLMDIRAEPTLAVESPATTEQPSDLHRHLGGLLANRVGGDVTFEIGGERVMAHRCVLAARSSVFMAEFFGPMKEKLAACVRIDDMEARVFKAMLHFIYTDSLPQMDEGEKAAMAQHLLVAADRYNMERLKRMCENMLRNYIDTKHSGDYIGVG